MQGGSTRNALLTTRPRAVAAPMPRAPLSHAAALAKAIGHAAILSDTPEKWAATVDMLRRSGIDPHGYESFKRGRPAAIAAAGYAVPPAQGERESQDER